jgi:hypothetical protein
MDASTTTDPSACTSPGADASPSLATPAAGVQTDRPVVTCTAYAGGYADIVIDGVAFDGVSVAWDTTDRAFILDTIGNAEAVEEAYWSGAMSEAIDARVEADDRGWAVAS